MCHCRPQIPWEIAFGDDTETIRTLVTRPARTLKRAIYPSGSNETFRFSKKYRERKKGYVQK